MTTDRPEPPLVKTGQSSTPHAPPTAGWIVRCVVLMVVAVLLAFLCGDLILAVMS